MPTNFSKMNYRTLSRVPRAIPLPRVAGRQGLYKIKLRILCIQAQASGLLHRKFNLLRIPLIIEITFQYYQSGLIS